jgi:hypothetical protein
MMDTKERQEWSNLLRLASNDGDGIPWHYNTIDATGDKAIFVALDKRTGKTYDIKTGEYRGQWAK